MARVVARILVLTLVLALVGAPPATAGDDDRRRGSCSGGPGHWTLRVGREDRRTLRIRFRIDDVRPGERWQIFLSDNGTGIFARTKRATDGGDVRVSIVRWNRRGIDRIAATGVNTRTGATCEGALRY